MTVPQAAAAMGISRQRALTIVKEGKLPAKQDPKSGRWEVDRLAVEMRAGSPVPCSICGELVALDREVVQGWAHVATGRRSGTDGHWARPALS